MCEICLHSPCLRGCPNEEIPVAGTCDHCGDDLAVGDKYVDLYGYHVCENCIDNMTVSDILEILDLSFETAEAPVHEWEDTV